MRKSTIVLSLLAGGIALAAMLALPSGSEAASDAQISKLRQQSCPELALPRERTYNPRTVDLAMRGRFIIAGDRVKLKPPVNWWKNHRESRKFQEMLHSLRWMDVLFQAAEEGNRRALTQARRLAVDWVKKNPRKQRWGKKGKGKKGPKAKRVPPLAWANLVAGVRTPYLGYVTRAATCANRMPKGHARILLKALRGHGDYLAGPGHYRSNHGLFTDLGLFLLADRYVPFIRRADEWQSLARSRFPRTLGGRTAASGIWLEHSADYHFLAIRLAETFMRFAGADDRTQAAVDRLKGAAPWFIAPDGQLALIGDTSASRPPVEYRRAAKSLNGHRTFLDAGYFVVRRNRSYFATISGFHNGSHKHADEGSFELFDRDTRVLTGPGKYGFDRDRRRNYVLSARAHNTLTVDGKSFTRDPKAAYGSGLVATGVGEPNWSASLVQNPLLGRQGVGHYRLFVYHPLVGLFIYDHLDSRSGKHKYSRHFQFGPDVRVRKHKKRGLRLHSKGKFEGCMRDEKNPQKASKLRLKRGKRKRLEGWVFPRGSKAIPRWTATLRSRGRDVEHLVGIGLKRGCPFRVERYEGPGILDFVLRRETEDPIHISVSRSDSTLTVTENEVDGPLPPDPPAPGLPLPGDSQDSYTEGTYTENP